MSFWTPTSSYTPSRLAALTRRRPRRPGRWYFDALILAAARLAGCATVYSEDLAAGQDYDGVCVENPLPT